MTLEALFALCVFALFIHALGAPGVDADAADLLALQKTHDLFARWQYAHALDGAPADFAEAFPGCRGTIDGRPVGCTECTASGTRLAVSDTVWVSENGLLFPRKVRVVVEC